MAWYQSDDKLIFEPMIAQIKTTIKGSSPGTKNKFTYFYFQNE